MATGRCAGCDDWGLCQGNSMHLWDDQSRQTVLCHRDVWGGFAVARVYAAL